MMNRELWDMQSKWDVAWVNPSLLLREFPGHGRGRRNLPELGSLPNLKEYWWEAKVEKLHGAEYQRAESCTESLEIYNSVLTYTAEDSSSYACEESEQDRERITKNDQRK